MTSPPPPVDILLSPPADDLAAVLGVPGVAGGGAGPGWAEIRVAGRQVRLGVPAMRQAVAVAEPHWFSPVDDEDDWRGWLLAAATAPGRRPAARRAMEQIAVAAAVAALPRPVPGTLAGSPRITLRISREWFGQLASAAPDDVAAITTAREQLASSLGIPMPAMDIGDEEWPPRVFGFRVGDLELPLRAAWAYAPPSTALQQIAQGLVTDVRRWAEVLVDPDTVEQIMKVIGDMLPDTVRAVRELVDPQRLSDVIRTLLAQRVPVAPIEPLLERLLGAAITQVPDDELVNYARAGLARQLAAAAGNGSRHIDAYVLARAPGPDEPLAGLGIPPSSADPWRDIVLVTPPGSAVPVWEMIRARFPDLLVIARDELPPACQVSPLATAGRADGE